MRLFLPILILTCLLIVPVTAQDTTDVPYIYYRISYGDAPAFIIERADGADPHVIPVDDFPLPFIVDTMWSSSGEWFAYTMTKRAEGDPQSYSQQRLPAAVNVDGRRVTVLDHFSSAVLSWSPTQDLLFVIGLPPQQDDDLLLSTDTAIYQLALIDPEQDTILASVQVPFVAFPDAYSIMSYYRIHWTADGRYLLFHYQDVLRDQRDFPANFQIFDLQQRTVTTMLNIWSPFSPINNGQALAILPSSIAVYTVDDNLILRGVPAAWPTLEEVHVPAPVDYLTAHPSEPMALVVLAGGQLWLLDLRDFQITFEQIAERVTGNDSDGGFVGTGHTSRWSPDGSYAVYNIQGEGLYGLSIADGSSTLLMTDVFGWRWRDDNLLEAARLVDDTVSYALINIERDIIAETTSEAGESGFSSSGAYVGGVAWDSSPYIQDLASGEITTVSPSGYAAPQSDYSGWFDWHPTTEWAIVKELSFVPMMGADPLLYSVVNTEGSIRRDISSCFQFCVDWLPEHVDVSKIRQANPDKLTPTPAKLYLADNYIYHLDWSPDSQSLLMGYGADGYEMLHIETGEIEVVERPESCFYCAVEWDGHTPILTDDINIWQAGETQTVVNDVGLEASLDYFGLWTTQYIFLRDTPSDATEARAFVPAWSFAFSPDGEYLAVGSGWELRLYRTEDLFTWLYASP